VTSARVYVHTCECYIGARVRSYTLYMCIVANKRETKRINARIYACASEGCVYVPVVPAHVNGYRFPRAPYRPSTVRSAINKAGSRRITRPFINSQFRQLGICHAYYNKQAQPCTILHRQGNIASVHLGILSREEPFGLTVKDTGSPSENRPRRIVESKRKLNYASIFPQKRTFA